MYSWRMITLFPCIISGVLFCVYIFIAPGWLLCFPSYSLVYCFVCIYIYSWRMITLFSFILFGVLFCVYLFIAGGWLMKRWEFNDLSNPGPHFTFKDRFISSPLILIVVASRHCLTFLLPAEALFLLFYSTFIFILEKFKELTMWTK